MFAARVRRWLRGSDANITNPTVSADAGSVAAGGSIINSLIKMGLDEKGTLEGFRRILEQEIPRLGLAKGVPEAPLQAVLLRLGEKQVPVEEIPARLAAAADDWKKQHDEISKAVNKLLLILIGFCFFCGLALGKPDVSLLANDAEITLPFANAEVSFVTFLVIAPLVLTALSFYLHILVGYWITLSRQMPGRPSAEQTHPVLPFVFNLPYRPAYWLSDFLFYWLVPIMLGAITWKALPRPEAPGLIALTSTLVVVFLFLQLRRRYDQTLSIISLLKWLMFLSGVSVAALAFYAWGQNRTLLSRSLHLPKAELKDQDLQFLNLSLANLTNADLSRANLTQQQVDTAFGTQTTKLPTGLKTPMAWK